MRKIFIFFGVIQLLILLSNPTLAENIKEDKFKLTPFSQKKESGKVPLKIAVVGLVHDHVGWILGREKLGDIQMVAIIEPNKALAKKYSTRYGYNLEMVFSSLEEMYVKVKPDAVTAFNSIYDHLSVVEFCAPKGIHVMVEKPLAVSVEHAEKMIKLAQQYGIHLITNYETTWYDSNWFAYDLVHHQQKIGAIQKIVFYTGHRGPREIGCSEEFLTWLTDPILNGAGALTDFGCYGANLSTWLMKGQHPVSVTCLTKQMKPDIYPKVDDDATIILTYPTAEVIIQASWNWPFGRKEMEVYGKNGYIFCKNGKNVQIMENEKFGLENSQAPEIPHGIRDPFAYLHQIIIENFTEPAFNLSSLENNRIVVQILEAAKISAKTGKTVTWKELYH